MKRSALKRIAVSVRRVLDSVFGSSAPQLCFEAFFRSMARLYLTENGFSSSDGLHYNNATYTSLYNYYISIVG